MRYRVCDWQRVLHFNGKFNDRVDMIGYVDGILDYLARKKCNLRVKVEIDWLKDYVFVFGWLSVCCLCSWPCMEVVVVHSSSQGRDPRIEIEPRADQSNRQTRQKQLYFSPTTNSSRTEQRFLISVLLLSSDLFLSRLIFYLLWSFQGCQISSSHPARVL